MIGRRKLPDPVESRFNALSIGVQYAPSFQWIVYFLIVIIEILTVLKQI